MTLRRVFQARVEGSEVIIEEFEVINEPHEVSPLVLRNPKTTVTHVTTEDRVSDSQMGAVSVFERRLLLWRERLVSELADVNRQITAIDDWLIPF